MLIIACFIFYITTGQRSNAGIVNVQEYCMFDTFAPRCSDREVILVQHAMYGRMAVGKCLKEYRFMGCSADVLCKADSKCSGKQTCSILIPNLEMTKSVSCLGDGLTAYLEASYKCVTVFQPKLEHCLTQERIEVSDSCVSLASEVALKTSCGLHETPWVIQAQPGQQLTIHLYDFFWNESNQTEAADCAFTYGWILDTQTESVIEICGGLQRHRILYISESNQIHIVFNKEILKLNRFLLKIEAVGCPTYVPPKYSWIETENDTILVGCISSKDRTQLHCINNKWIGSILSCTKTPEDDVTLLDSANKENNDFQALHSSSVKPKTKISKNHVIVFTIACLTVLICLAVIFGGIFFTKRYDFKMKKMNASENYNTILAYRDHNNDSYFLNSSTQQTNNFTLSRPLSRAPMTSTPHDTLCLHHPDLCQVEQYTKLPIRPKYLSRNVSRNTSIEYENISENESMKYFRLEMPMEISPPKAERTYQSIKLDTI